MDTNKHSLFIFSSKQNRVFFFKASLLFMVVVLFCMVWVPYQMDKKSSLWLEDKLERLSAIEGPKIVLIGNSNVTYGFHTEELEQEFGLPVVNMGCYGLMGNIFHENMTKWNVHPGDLYIICHTTYSDPKAYVSNFYELWSTLGAGRLRWEYFLKYYFDASGINEKDFMQEMLGCYPSYLKSCLKKIMKWTIGLEEIEPIPPTLYCDAYGFKPETILTNDSVFITQTADMPGPKTIDRLNGLARWLNEHGAEMVVAGYPIAYGEFTPSLAEYEIMQEKLEAGLDCPVISDFHDYLYPYSDFYNTIFHLTDPGAERRTKQLIEDLHTWMQKSGYRMAETTAVPEN